MLSLPASFIREIDFRFRFYFFDRMREALRGFQISYGWLRRVSLKPQVGNICIQCNSQCALLLRWLWEKWEKCRMRHVCQHQSLSDSIKFYCKHHHLLSLPLSLPPYLLPFCARTTPIGVEERYMTDTFSLPLPICGNLFYLPSSSFILCRFNAHHNIAICCRNRMRKIFREFR